MLPCIQDAIKKTSKDELPDFYNIQLERPKDDAKGYDVLFIDAASKVACSRKHPNKHTFTCTTRDRIEFGITFFRVRNIIGFISFHCLCDILSNLLRFKAILY